MLILLAWHAACPHSIHINRGNHEAIGMNLKDGFHKELMEKYQDSILFDLFQGKLLVYACGFKSVRM